MKRKTLVYLSHIPAKAWEERRQGTAVVDVVRGIIGLTTVIVIKTRGRERESEGGVRRVERKGGDEIQKAPESRG